MTDRIAFVGGGNMAYALAMGLAQADDPPSIIVADPVAAQLERFENPRIETTDDNTYASEGADAIVLAVKPQVMESVVRPMVSSLRDGLVMSIAAGVPMSAISAWLGEKTPIVRCMPNTPALIGSGVTGMIANRRATPAHTALAERIMGATGSTVWFDTDADLDAVTAISGSGPAYFFYLIEAMVDSGVELGLTQDAARRLAVETALGASRMVAESDEGPAQLRTNVTSPGGTTEAAIAVLDSSSTHDVIQAAIKSAHERSQELAKEFG